MYVPPRHPRLARRSLLNTRASSTPPVVETLIDNVLIGPPALMQHGAQTTPELGVDVLARTPPAEVRIVAVTVRGNGAEELGQLTR